MVGLTSTAVNTLKCNHLTPLDLKGLKLFTGMKKTQNENNEGD